MSKKSEKRQTAPVHPGLILQDEMREIGITQTALAEHIGVLPKSINQICGGKRGISAEMAWRLSHALGASPNFWLNLQNNWELSQVHLKHLPKPEKMAA